MKTPESRNVAATHEEADEHDAAIAMPPEHRDRSRSATKTNKSAATRRRIMDVATRFMVERGGANFRMSEVSQECGMSKGALYYYFADKDDLVYAIFDAAIDDLASAVDNVIATISDPGMALRAIANEFSNRVGEKSPLPMAIMHELVRLREETLEVESMRILHVFTSIVATIEKAKEAGVIRADVDSRLAATMASGAYTFSALSASAGGEIEWLFADDALDIMIRGIGLQTH